MARRLTSFSKLLITLLILVFLFFGGRYLLQSTEFGKNLTDQAEQATADRESDSKASSADNKSGNGNTVNSSSRDANDDVLKVQLVSWGGYAPGLYFNEGAKASTRSRYFKEYGVKVEFILENDLFNALDAWIAGEYDVIVQTADAFPLYTAPSDINQFKPQAFMQVDWSRGGDALIAKRGINSANDLKGKKVAVTVPSPSQTMLITALEAAGLDYKDIEVVKTSDNFKAAELFRSNDIDAAVVWSPDDIFATKDVPGSKVLLTSREQSNIIADIMFAKADVISKKGKQINAFYEGWMKAVAELKNKSNQEKAAKYLAEFNQLSVDDAKGMMDNVYWTTHGDNLNFFGLNSGFKGMKGGNLYEKMSRKFVETGDAETEAPSWRSVINTSAISSANLSGNAHAAEKSPTFQPATEADKQAPAFAKKPVSISFNTGQYQLSENAKTLIDLQFVELAKSYGNVKIRVEGNTDSTGGYQMNKDLSQKRAKAVSDYLINEYGMNRNRFVIVGNGPDKPVAGCESNSTEACKAKNRRTEFQLISS